MVIFLTILSLVYYTNKKGPRAVPCGTPKAIMMGSDIISPTLVAWCPLKKKI